MLCTCNTQNLRARNIICSQSVQSVVKSKVKSPVVARAGRGSRSADVLATTNLSTPGVKAWRRVWLRRRRMVGVKFSIIDWPLTDVYSTYDANCDLLTECTKCMPGKEGLTCCGWGGSWFKKCGDDGDTKFEHTWGEGLAVCADEILNGTLKTVVYLFLSVSARCTLVV